MLYVMSQKRKRVVVPLEKKLEALRRVDRGHAVKVIASELGVGEVTVGDWKRRRQEIEEWCERRSFGTGCETVKRKTMKKGELKRTSEALYMWFLKMKEKSRAVTGPMLQNKALELSKYFCEGEGFTASNGWLNCWKKRYSIWGKQLSMTGEKLSATEDTAESASDKIQMIKEESVSFDEIDSCNEKVNNYNLFPEETSEMNTENLHLDFMESKDDLLLPECSNLSVSYESSTENDVISVKQKRVFLSLKRKLDAIKRLDQGETLRKVARELGVGESTVWDWKKKREDIEKWCSQRSADSGSSAHAIRKTMRKGEFEKTSEALFSWYLQMKSKGSQVSGPILQSKALELYRNFNEGEEFTASSGWLERWKKRYGISGKKLDMTGEKLSVTEETAAFSVKVETATEEENFCLDENHSCSETVMNFKMASVELFSTNSSANNEENLAVEYKQSENKLSAMTSPNVSVSCGDNLTTAVLSGKRRKHLVVSLKKKLDALKRLDQGETMKKVAKELGVGGATVWDWRKKRKEIEKWCSERYVGNGTPSTIRKTMRRGEFEKTSEALFLWFLQTRKKRIPISGPVLQNKALKLHKQFNEGEFTASSGWLERWKKRYGIRAKKCNITGTTLLAGTEEAAEVTEDNYSFNERAVGNKTPVIIEDNFTIDYKHRGDESSTLAQSGIPCGSSTVNGVMAGKRKHVVVSLEKKLEALKRLDQGQKIRRVASELGVGEATVGDWKKKREEIEKWCLQRSLETGRENVHRKTMKKGEFEKTSEALYIWFLEMKENGTPVSGPVLQSKALELHKSFNEGTEFTASNGWFERWKRRYGISGKKLNITVEKSIADVAEKAAFITKIEKMSEEESSSFDRNYSSDEEVVNYNRLPVKISVSSKDDTALKYNQSQDRLTPLASSNLSDNPKKNHSKTVEEEVVMDETTKNTAPADPREDVQTLMNSVKEELFIVEKKEEPFIVEENYNIQDVIYPEEFVFVSCDTDCEKVLLNREEDPENCLLNQSLLGHSIKSENIEQ